MGETRINLKHLLEDIRDSYPLAIEEVILTELVANGLDSGASEILITTDEERRSMTVADNGKGMKRKELKTYHDIAATTKTRGNGIGFAGVGAKLALLIAQTVVTETKSASFHGATTWHLKTPLKAPWQYTLPLGLLKEKGTMVTIYLDQKDSLLIRPNFVQQAIWQHFLPLLNSHFDPILKLIYKKGIRFFINGEPLALPQPANTGLHRDFFVRMGKRRNPIGIGFIAKYAEPLSQEFQGIAIATFGKVIKKGWDWLGLIPKGSAFISGAIEIPELAKILTTNKADFLRDKNSLKLYYQFRKAIQSALVPILQDFGEDIALESNQWELKVRPLEKEMGGVLGGLVGDFPELAALVGWTPSTAKEARVRGVPKEPAVIIESLSLENTKAGTAVLNPAQIPEETLADHNGQTEPASGETKSVRKRASLAMGFTEEPTRKELGWLVDNTLWINQSHPAYLKAKALGLEGYHKAFTIAWVLAGYVETEKSQREFLNRFLELWGRTTQT
ncbi:MAG: ATP-binding protein [Elusimicrobia bacterium]|nr:ATP-binding protein [Elusimicrobiota bacterium]